MATKKKKATAQGPDALLAQILAEPKDLELRVVYADALIEAGDPRGTFIAQQCALAKLDALDERYPALLASTRRLEVEHAHAWIAEYATRTKLAKAHAEARGGLDPHLNAVFVNGFLQRIAIAPELIAKHWSWLREREPITGMELLVGEDVDRSYRKLEEPKILTTLKVSPDSWFTASSVGNVLAWGMPHLRDLDLSRCDLAPTGCRLLANESTDLAQHFEDYVAPPPFARGQLERLALRNCNVLDAGARTLFGADNLTGIAELDLAQNKIADPATLEALRKAPAMAGLRRLTLSGNNPLGEELSSLSGWTALPQLVQLALPQTTTRASFAALFPSASASLRELDLRSAKLLLQYPETVTGAAQGFTSLDLGGTSLGDKHWATLLAAPSVRRLVHLFANGCGLSDDAIDVLVASDLRRLVTLDLSSNKLTDRALEALGAWPGLEHVTNLRIGNHKKLTLAGYQALIDAPAFQPAAFDVGKPADATALAPLRERFGAALVTKE